MPRVYLYSLGSKQQTAVTDSWYGSGEPVFSDDGKYLLLASARDFKPTFCDQEFANVYRDMQRVYLVTPAKETANPLEPKSAAAPAQERGRGQGRGKARKAKSEGTGRETADGEAGREKIRSRSEKAGGSES